MLKMKSKAKTTIFTALAHSSKLILVWLAVSCTPCIEGEGEIMQESFDVDQYSVVNLKCRADVYLSQNLHPSTVTVKAPQNVIDILSFKVSGNRLSIDSETCFNTDERVEIYLNTKEFEGIEINGSGDVHSLTDLIGSSMEIEINGSGDVTAEVSFRRLSVDINGSGDVRLAGRADRMEVSINGSGDVKAPNMTCESTSVSINGSGDAFINAEKYLEAYINGSGDVRYTGWPSDTTYVVRGSGNVKPNR